MQTMPSPKGVQNNHMATLVKAAKQQTTPELFGIFRNLPPGPTPPRAGTCLRNPQQHTPELSGNLRNFPDPASGTYTSTNLPPEPTAACTGTLRNPPELAGPCLRNLHQHAPEPASGTHRNSSEPSGTFLRNLLLQPAPAHTGTHRNLAGLKTTLACAVGEKAVDDQSLWIPKQLTTKIIRIANQLTTALI